MEVIKQYFEKLRKITLAKINDIETYILSEVLPDSEPLNKNSTYKNEEKQKSRKNSEDKYKIFVSNDEYLDSVVIDKIDELYSLINFNLETLEKEMITLCDKIKRNLVKINSKNIFQNEKPSLKEQKLLEKDKFSLELLNSIFHNHNGMWFHPRELIQEDVLATSGKNGIIKLFDAKKLNLIYEVKTGKNWVTALKYDIHLNELYVSSCSDTLLIYKYNVKERNLVLFNEIKTSFTTIYGICSVNTGNTKILALSGQNTYDNSVFLYSKLNNNSFVHSFSPKNKETSFRNSFSKAMIYAEKYNMLIVGLHNGFVEAYQITNNESRINVNFQYSLDCGLKDWVFQIQFIESSDLLIFCNANCLYFATIGYVDIKIIQKINFLSSIYDFSYCIEFDYIFLKLKPGIILIYEISNRKIVYQIDETQNQKGVYENCLLVSKNNRMVYSGRDNVVLVYKF